MVQQQSRPAWIAEKQVPNDKRVEMRVLSSVLDNPTLLEKVDFLTPEDFYYDEHKVMYKAILSLRAHHRPIDQIALEEEVQRNGDMEVFAQNPLFFLDFTSAEAAVSDPSGDAQYLKELSVCRSIAYGIHEPTKLAFNGEAKKAFEALQELTYRLHVGEQKSEPVAVAEMSTNFITNLTTLCDRKGQIIGVPTGFTDLDRLTGGLQKSDLIILAARPAIGKSSFALSLASNAAKHGYGIALFSLEMGREQLYQRLIAMEAGIDQQRLRTGWIDDEDWEKIVGAIERINNMSIYIDDSAAVTPDEIRNKVRRLITSGVNIGSIVVDYLQLMSLPGKSKNTNREQEVSEISRQLKGVARDLDMPVLSLAQLSRAVETRQSKIPQMSDLRESGGLENNADIVMFLYRDDVYNPESERPNTADLIVAKHRNGPLGTVSLYFEKSQTKFKNLYVETPIEQ